jgi:hypothetical protein
MNNDPTNTFKMLQGRTIKRVHLHGINCVTLETTDGKWFRVETVCILPSLGVYGMEVVETNEEKTDENSNTVR